MAQVKKGDDDFKRYQMDVQEFCKLVGIESGGNGVYIRMAGITRSLMGRIIELDDLDEKIVRQRPLLSAANYRALL